MNFTGEKCLVCENIFNADDDIVVCPECGTPHHRECWLKNGECINTSLHKTGFEYKTEAPEKTEETSPAVSVSEITDEEAEMKKRGFIPFNDPGFNSENAEQNASAPENSVKIDGSDIKYFAACVGPNAGYYLPRFVAVDKKKNILFNSGAFLVPFAWAIYRKMYKFALVAFALYIGLIFITAFPMFSNEEYMQSLYEVVNENPENPGESLYNITMYQYSDGNVQLTEKQANFIKASENIQVSRGYIALIYIYSFGMHILGGLFATKFYFEKINKKIKSLERLDGFGNMSDVEIAAYLLAKKPTLPFALAAIIGFFEFMLIQL